MITSPGAIAGIPGGYGAIVSAAIRPAAVSALAVSRVREERLARAHGALGLERPDRAGRPRSPRLSPTALERALERGAEAIDALGRIGDRDSGTSVSRLASSRRIALGEEIGVDVEAVGARARKGEDELRGSWVDPSASGRATRPAVAGLRSSQAVPAPRSTSAMARPRSSSPREASSARVRSRLASMAAATGSSC